jgi:hypothetical protein
MRNPAYHRGNCNDHNAQRDRFMEESSGKQQSQAYGAKNQATIVFAYWIEELLEEDTRQKELQEDKTDQYKDPSWV